MTTDQLLARVQENADACEKIFKRKLADAEYAEICQLVGKLAREEEKQND